MCAPGWCATTPCCDDAMERRWEYATAGTSDSVPRHSGAWIATAAGIHRWCPAGRSCATRHDRRRVGPRPRCRAGPALPHCSGVGCSGTPRTRPGRCSPARSACRRRSGTAGPEPYPLRADPLPQGAARLLRPREEQRHLGLQHQALAYRTPAEAYRDPHPAHPAAAGKEQKQAQAHDGDELDSISTQEGDASTLELPTFVS